MFDKRVTYISTKITVMLSFIFYG